MEIGFDTILYIIIGIVIFIVNILGKNKKKVTRPVIESNQTNPEELSNEEEYDLISNFENLFSPKEEPKEEKIEEVTIKKEEQKNKYGNTIEVVERSTKDKSVVSTETITPEEQEKEDINNDFDLKEAVIHTEILNRKYF